MVEIQTKEKKFLLDAQRNAWRETVKWAFFGYVLDRAEDESITGLAQKFIEQLGLEGRFSEDSLKKYYYDMKSDFAILNKCAE